MSSSVPIDRIKQNAKLARDTIDELKKELEFINKEYNALVTQQLREENNKLTIAIEAAKNRLVDLEVTNGVKQVPVPNQHTAVQQKEETDLSHGLFNGDALESVKEVKPKKEKKVKEPKESQVELPVDVGRLDLRVGKIEEVQRHPDADSLYVLKINTAEEKLRTVCSGLVKYVTMDELKDRSVLLLCNLKPVKMRGIISEAMVMCASSEKGVEVLVPPDGSMPGEFVHCDGYTRQPDPIMNPKKKIFETVAVDLHTNDNFVACFKGVPLNLPGKGYFLSKTLKNALVK